MTERVLLTGAIGFIGRHVLARLRQDTGYEVVPIGRRVPLGDWPLKDFEAGVREQSEAHLRAGTGCQPGEQS